MLNEVLRRRAEAIEQRWSEEALRVYSPEAFRVFDRQRDRFANPVGHSLRAGIRDAFRALLEDAGTEALRAALDGIVSIRAVQELSASEAVGFVFALKRIVREEIGDAVADPGAAGEMAALDAGIDRAALTAFDLYVAHRQRLYEVRVAELKRSIPWIVGRATDAASRDLGEGEAG